MARNIRPAKALHVPALTSSIQNRVSATRPSIRRRPPSPWSPRFPTRFSENV